MKRYFLGLSSTYSAGDTFRHTFATGSEYDLSELRAFLAAHYGTTYDHVAVYSNGRTALNMAIKALMKRGGKIVVTSMTCYAVIQAIKDAGCVPVFADIDKETLHFGKKELEKALEGEENVQAVLVQNNLGIPADMAGIEEVATAKKLIIIEDLAHCVGVRYADGREAGTVGRAAILSFGKGKSIDGITGGAVVFSNPLDPPVTQPGEPPVFKDNFRARFYPLFSSIIRGGYRLNRKLGRGITTLLVKIHAIKRSADGDIDPNARLTFWQCKVVLRKLKKLPHRARKPLRDFYLVDDRDAVLAELAKAGFEFSDIWYETPVAPERYFHKADFHPDACPVASEVAMKIVNVPTWYDKEDMKPALKIIKAHLINPDEISAEEIKAIEKTEFEIEIENRKKERKEKREQAVKEKLSKLEPKAVLKVAKAAKEKSEEKRKKKQEDSAKTKEELEKEKAKEREEKAELKEEAKKKKAEDKKEKELEKREKLSKERDDSGLLLAMEKAKEKAGLSNADKNEESTSAGNRYSAISETVPREGYDPSEVSAARDDGTARTGSKKSTETISAEPAKPVIAQKEQKVEKTEIKKPKTSSDSMPGMRVAPEKLSDREKLKRELEQGKKEERSVF